MTGATLTLPTLTDFRESVTDFIKRDGEAFAKLCRDNWPSGDAMANDLASHGLIRSPKTCRNWRNAATNVRYADARAVKYIIRRRKALRKADETRAEIEKLQARIAELEAGQ